MGKETARRIGRRAPFFALLAGLVLGATAQRAGAIELCSPEARERMRAVGIGEGQIDALCPPNQRTGRLLTISIQRTENDLGYCQVTLALRNDTIHYLNTLSLTTAAGRFEIFNFNNILPGGTGYASARSRSLLDCDELNEVKVVFLWPGSLRLDDQPLEGRRLEQFKPALEGRILQWSP